MTLTWDGLFHSTSSFGVLSTRFVEELVKLGVDVRIDPWGESVFQGCGGLVTALKFKGHEPGGVRIRVSHPNGACPGSIPFVFFEDSELTCQPDDLERTVNTLRTFPLVLVSSHYCKVTLAAYGVKSEVVSLGSDVPPCPFPDMTGMPQARYTFLCIAAPGKRKGLDLLSRAFNEVSPGRNMKLILKSDADQSMALGNVEWIGRSLTAIEMENLFRISDCFVLPTRGEAFCLPALDAAKAGLPVIITGWGGQTDFTDPQWHVRYELARRDDGAGGLWAEPDFEHLKELMIACYEKRPQPEPLAGWTWGQAAEILLDILRGADLL